jgi:hypothetical protein
MLPLEVAVGGLTVAYATAEPVAAGDGTVRFRALTADAFVAVRGDVTCGDPMTEVRRNDVLTEVSARAPGEFTVSRSPDR